MTLATLFGTALLGGALAYRAYRAFEADLPAKLDAVTEYRPLRASQVFAADGELIGEFFVERRVMVPPAAIPQLVRHAFVAAEDERFYAHHGIDYQGIARAAWVNLRAGHVVQGGSSITQQVAKLLIVGQERSLARKAREALLALRIEKRIDKDHILGIYLNHVYLGHGAYGVGAAAAAYFGKQVQDLTLAEAALLAGLPKAPGRATPFRDFARAQARQRYVLDQMVAAGFASPKAADEARREPIVLVSRERALTNVAAPYFVETVRRYIAEHYGDEDLLEKGLRIHTTLDMRLQRAAEAALRRGLEDIERVLGFAGPLAHLDGDARRKFLTGLPRPFGPGGFDLGDAEGTELLVPDPEQTPGAELDARKPGALLTEAEAKRAARAEAAGRKPARGRAPSQLPEGAFVDPDLTYAAAVTAIGKRVTLGSGGLVATLDVADEAKLLSWIEVGEGGAKGARRIGPGDVVPVRFARASDRKGEPRKGEAGDHFVATLASTPGVQGAFMAVDPSNGHLLAMVGGYDYDRSQFNRAVQARRQIGSAIKPFVYATAIDKGLHELTIRWDVPVKFKTASGTWAPRNYKREFLGPVTLRTALAKSINTVSAQLTAQFGVDAVIETMRNMGIRSKLPHQLSLALGTADLSLEEAVYAISALPAGGRLVPEVTMTRLIDAEGRVLEDHTASKPTVQSLDPETAFVLTDLMRGVVENGTGRKAKELGRPAAGKTGTSNEYRDAWFLGFTPELAAGVWLGRDDFKPIGHGMTGGQVGVPIWLAFMQEALRGRPVADFVAPPGIVYARADPEKGLPATPGTPGSRLVPFKRGTLPPLFRMGTPTTRFADAPF